MNDLSQITILNLSVSAMDKSQPAKVHRFVEALYDIESGQTIVRQGHQDGAGVQPEHLRRELFGAQIPVPVTAPRPTEPSGKEELFCRGGPDRHNCADANHCQLSA
jgi:hypothetical protein